MEAVSDSLFIILVVEAFLDHLCGESLLADTHLHFSAEFVERLLNHGHRHRLSGGYGAVACGDFTYDFTIDLDGIAMAGDGVALEFDSDNAAAHAFSLLKSEGFLAYEFLLVEFDKHREACLGE